MHDKRFSAPYFALLLAVASGFVQNGAAPPSIFAQEATPVAIFDMKSMGGRPLLDIMLNGRGPYTFFMDTGAAHSVLDAGLAQQLELPIAGSIQTGSPLGTGAVEVDLVSLSSVTVGDLVFENQQMALLDLAGMMPGEQMPLGVLSYRLFAGHLLEFDYPQQKMRVYEGELPTANGRDIFAFDTPIPSIPVALAGQTFDMHLDTGSPSSFMLPLAAAASLPLRSEPEVVGRGRTVDADFTVLAAKLDGSAVLAATTIETPTLHFIEGAPVGNIGSELLARFVVTIDPTHSRIRLATPSPFGQTTDAPRRMVIGGERKRYGIRFFDLGGDPLAVADVDAGAIAAAAGLVKGDLITAINGQPVSHLDQAARIAALRGRSLQLTVQRGETTQILTMSIE